MSEAELVALERDDDVVTLTFQDPERHNAMSRAMGEALKARIERIGEDRSVRAVLLTGAGRAFSAGGDLGMLLDLAEQAAAGRALQETRDQMREFYGLFLSVRTLPCPSIAAINGHAIGAGLCVALACDLRVASTSARLALNFSRLGLHPGMAATWILPRLVGPARAAELLYTGRSISAAEAERIGMLNRAVAPEEVLSEARQLARAVATSGPQAVRGLKRSLAGSAHAELEAQLQLEATLQAACFASRDVTEGLAALRERREPEFEDR